jgi:hypothetical protein
VKFLQFPLTEPSAARTVPRFRVEAYRVHTKRYLCILTLDVVVCPDTKPGNPGLVLTCVGIYILVLILLKSYCKGWLSKAHHLVIEELCLCIELAGSLVGNSLIYVSHLKVGDDISKLLLIENIRSPHLGIWTVLTNHSVANTYAENILLSKIGVCKGVSGFALKAKHGGSKLKPDGVSKAAVGGRTYGFTIGDAKIVFEHSICHITPNHYTRIPWGNSRSYIEGAE